MAEQEQYNQEKLNVRYLLSLSLIKMYTVQNLKNEHILDRFLRLLFHKRYEQNRQFMKCLFIDGSMKRDHVLTTSLDPWTLNHLIVDLPSLLVLENRTFFTHSI